MTSKFMYKTLSKSMQTWNISYNPYTDIFQIFNKEVFALPNSQLAKQSKGDALIVYKSDTNTPILIEFRTNTSELLGDIDNMSKKNIINNVVRYVESHAR